MFVLSYSLPYLGEILKKMILSFNQISVNDHLNAPVEINAILNFLNVYKGSLFHGTPFSMLEMIRILFTNFSLQGKNIETKWAATKSYYKMCFFLKPTILWWRIQIWLYKKNISFEHEYKNLSRKKLLIVMLQLNKTLFWKCLLK